MSDWKVRIDYDWARDLDELAIYRYRGNDTVEVIDSIGDTGPIIATYHEGIQISTRLRLPRGVIDLIAQAAKPGPTQAEMDRVVEALAVERRRVDNMLAVLNGQHA